MSRDDRRAWLARAPQPARSRTLSRGAWIVTAMVLILVGLMRNPSLRIPLPEGFTFDFLPPVHALLNTGVALALIAALVAILRGNVRLHRRFILVAMGLSIAFLCCYAAYHFTSAEVKFGDADGNGVVDPVERAAIGSTRTIYLLLLISHIVLAGLSLPAILLTFIAGWTNHFARHRRLARWVFPLWLYVAITGPICYLMLRPYY